MKTRVSDVLEVVLVLSEASFICHTKSQGARCVIFFFVQAAEPKVSWNFSLPEIPTTGDPLDAFKLSLLG